MEIEEQKGEVENQRCDVISTLSQQLLFLFCSVFPGPCLQPLLTTNYKHSSTTYPQTFPRLPGEHSSGRRHHLPAALGLFPPCQGWKHSEDHVLWFLQRFQHHSASAVGRQAQDHAGEHSTCFLGDLTVGLRDISNIFNTLEYLLMYNMADYHIVIFNFSVFLLVIAGRGPPRQKKNHKRKRNFTWSIYYSTRGFQFCNSKPYLGDLRF